MGKPKTIKIKDEIKRLGSYLVEIGVGHDSFQPCTESVGQHYEYLVDRLLQNADRDEVEEYERRTGKHFDYLIHG